MVAITATNSATLSLQASVTKSRMEQAKREAAQAENTAETLRAQAQEQDHVAEKAHERERNLNASQASAGSSTQAAPTVNAPVSSAPKTAGQSGASYVETLDTVLQGPNSPAQSAYTFPVQKNLVLSNLFQRANQVWQATPPDTRVAKLYAGKSSAGAGTGSLLSVEA